MPKPPKTDICGDDNKWSKGKKVLSSKELAQVQSAAAVNMPPVVSGTISGGF